MDNSRAGPRNYIWGYRFLYLSEWLGSTVFCDEDVKQHDYAIRRLAMWLLRYAWYRQLAYKTTNDHKKNMSQSTRESAVIRNTPIPALATCLTAEQLDCLRRCARGISLRFDEPSDVDALVAAGYATQGVARVVTMTAEGLRYLQTRATDFRAKEHLSMTSR